MWLWSTLHHLMCTTSKMAVCRSTSAPPSKKVKTFSKIGSAHVLRLENVLNTFDENVDEVQESIVKMTRGVTY